MSDDQVEVWRNETAAVQQIRRFGDKGRTVAELIRPGRTFEVSPKERRFDEQAVVDSRNDRWRNGTFLPLQLVETEEDAADLAGNPNQIGESEMAALIEAPQRDFDRRVDEVTNPVILKRLLELADEQGASVKKIRKLQGRIAALDPTSQFASKIRHVGNVNDADPAAADDDLYAPLGPGAVSATR